MEYDYEKEYLAGQSDTVDCSNLGIDLSALIQKSYAASQAWEHFINNENGFSGDLTKVIFAGILIDEEYDKLVSKLKEKHLILNFDFCTEIIPMVLDRIDLASLSRKAVKEALQKIKDEQ